MTRIVTLNVAAGVVVAAHAPGVTAATAEETQNVRPAFEHVQALAFDSEARTVWLGAHTGLFRRENGGMSWSKVRLPVGHNDPGIMAVTAHPRDAAILYVATHEAGV